MHHNGLYFRFINRKLTSLALLYFLISPSLSYLAWTLEYTLEFTLFFTLIIFPVISSSVMRFFIQPKTASLTRFVSWITLFLFGASALLHSTFPPLHWSDSYFIRIITLTLIYPIFMMTLTSDVSEHQRDSLLLYRLAWIILIGTATFGVIQAHHETGNYFLLFRNWETDSTFNYQFFGDMLAIVSLMLLPNIKRFKVIFFIISVISIFFSYSRSAILCFLISAVILFVVNNEISRVRKFGVAVALAVVILLTTMVAASLNIEGLEIAFNRLGFIFGAEDASAVGRREISLQVLENIGDKWLYGQFLYELEGPGEGGYVHNILSYLLSYGVIPFTLLIAVIVMSVISSLKNSIVSGFEAGVAGVLIFSVLSVFFFRSHVWYQLWFALGLAGSVRRFKIVLPSETCEEATAS